MLTQQLQGHDDDQRHVICNVCKSKFEHLPPSRADLIAGLTVCYSVPRI
jgi:hypothetical protein